jgi:hypothetical protein
MEPKSPGPPPVPGLFLIGRQVGRRKESPSSVGAIAVAQGGLASGLSAGWPPVPDRETLSLVDLTDHRCLWSHADKKCVDVTVQLSESTLIARPPLSVTQVQQFLQTLIVCHSTLSVLTCRFWALAQSKMVSRPASFRGGKNMLTQKRLRLPNIVCLSGV